MLDLEPARPVDRGPTDRPVARLHDLRVSLSRNSRRTEVVRGVDLEIGRGEIVGVVGQSGSGKSVMSLALMGLLPASALPQVSGAVEVDGVDMATAPEAARRRVRRLDLGVVFQDPMTSLNPTMRIGRQVAEAAGSPAEAIRLLRAVGIPQPEQRYGAYPHELSGGLRQRVMIAIAIAGDPALIIADEPTTALDVTVQAQVLRVLAGLRDELGCSILMITHDLGVAAQIADRIAVMYAGEVVEEGPALGVLEAPQHPYTRGLLRARLSLETERGRPLHTGLTDAGALDPDAGTDARAPSGTEPATAVEEAVVERTTVSAPARSEAILRLTEVRCEFAVRDARGRRATLAALRGVTLDVQEGESLALVGESGSGKSTLLRAVAGLETRYTGTIDGPPRSDVQMVFQDAGASLTPWLSTEALLLERLRGRDLSRVERRERVREALDRVGLPETTLAAKPSELSGGQRQRVALARATIVPPRILLCDEPTSALDVSLAANVLNLIHDLRRQMGMTVLFVTHDLAVARIVSDRLAVMYLGRLVETGPVEKVIAEPAHPYTRALVAAVPGARRELPVIVGEPASPMAPPTGCAFHPRCPVMQDECPSTLEGIQLVEIGPRADVEARQHRVACVLRGEF
ncbi:dipeptide ABC transporter ATP-binding protein [Cellulomonas aerilata]|uniref:ABC transporter permease n=1 Tax=Cellulomonas aerilata TaxID=515326 RepID=A0A512DCB3_9CELL|nr:ABC transporter ATP-binding protein [Cellulomonas aerilata]GEO34095.1 ABC transporter permease [Cellulomonas aerilata]